MQRRLGSVDLVVLGPLLAQQPLSLRFDIGLSAAALSVDGAGVRRGDKVAVGGWRRRRRRPVG